MKRLVVLAAAGLLVAGCGPVHPGDAAVVDGTSISMEQLDRTAEIYCTVTARSAEQQGVDSVDNADVRRQAITDLVLTQIAQDVVDERGLTVDGSLVDLTPEQLDQIENDFGGDSSEIVDTIRGSRELYATFIAIGADESGQEVTDENVDDVALAGQDVVEAAVADHDVRFAPRLGISADGLPNGSIGSLSVKPVDLDEATGDELPAALQCSA